MVRRHGNLAWNYPAYNCLQTILSQVWYPVTVATVSRYQKEILKIYLTETAESTECLPKMLDDYGFRGVSSIESAGIGGAAHMVNFTLSNTMAGLLMARRYYNCKMAASSVAASEHSTVTSWSKDNEVDAHRHHLEMFSKYGFSAVSDSYDLYGCCRDTWGKHLKEVIKRRMEANLPFYVRPDSGDPVKVVLKVLNILGQELGSTVNSKGYRVLPPFLKVMHGDGISYDTLAPILENMKCNKWSAENVLYGSGAALLQRLDRDTQKCAYKCSYIEVNGKGTNVFKQPITDPGKTSKKGRLSLEKINGIFKTIEEGKGDPQKDILVTVFENGKLLRNYNLDEVRQNANCELPIKLALKLNRTN